MGFLRPLAFEDRLRRPVEFTTIADEPNGSIKVRGRPFVACMRRCAAHVHLRRELQKRRPRSNLVKQASDWSAISPLAASIEYRNSSIQSHMAWTLLNIMRSRLCTWKIKRHDRFDIGNSLQPPFASDRIPGDFPVRAASISDASGGHSLAFRSASGLNRANKMGVPYFLQPAKSFDVEEFGQ